MKRRIIILGILIIVAFSLSEAHSILREINQKLAYTEMDLFIKKDFHYSIILEWYIKTTFDDFLFISAMFAAAHACYQYSYKLFLIFCVLFGYGCMDLFLFWYNYKIDNKIFWVGSICFILFILFLVLPIENRTTKYRSLV
jgi:hypothetical protein